MADFASAARNAPSEDGECWQRVELGIHGLRSWGRNWSRKVRETWNSGGLQGHEGETGHLLSGAREAWLAPNAHLATVLPPPVPRLTLHDARTSGARSCADTSPLATAIHRPPKCQRPNGARSRGATPLFQYVTKPGDCCGQIDPFFPTRLRPIVNHSLEAGGAQGQWLQACLPDGHQPQRLCSHCSA